MNTQRRFKILNVIIAILLFASCHKKEDAEITPQLSLSSSEVLFTASSGTSEVIVTSNTKWSISYSAAWCAATASVASGDGKISLNVQSNATTGERSFVIAVAAGPISKEIKVRQAGQAIPDSVPPPDATGMNDDAAALAAKIKLGWNIGNSLEAIGGETAWGNPQVTKALIDKVKQSGFNAVRIPCSWDQYTVNGGTQLKTDWLNRVKQVVQYCIDDSLYVILNIHWDGGWLDNNINAQAQASVNNKQHEFWKQIATTLRDFDEHLMFASSNEPPVDNSTQMDILLSYHQTFVNTVRSTGGRNAYRVLVVQGPSTDIDKTTTLMNSIPADPIANRLMVEVHYYSPWQFCGLTSDASWGNMFYYWGKDFHSVTDPSRNATWGEEDYLDAEFLKMKSKFVDKGMPVVLGEFGAIRHTSLTADALTLHLASRAYWNKYITQKAKANGMLPFYWDAGSVGDNGSGIFNRQNNTVGDQQVLDALIQGAQ